jgi:hypothetical protein
MEMPKVSRDSAPQRQEAGPVVDLGGELDGYTVSFTSLLEDIDATPLMKGLPDDRCPCPHWGYVLKGKMVALTPETAVVSGSVFTRRRQGSSPARGPDVARAHARPILSPTAIPSRCEDLADKDERQCVAPPWARWSWLS